MEDNKTEEITEIYISGTKNVLEKTLDIDELDNIHIIGMFNNNIDCHTDVCFIPSLQIDKNVSIRNLFFTCKPLYSPLGCINTEHGSAGLRIAGPNNSTNSNKREG